jgi:hypothetical protein
MNRHFKWFSTRLLKQRAIMTPSASADGQTGPPVKTGGAMIARQFIGRANSWQATGLVIADESRIRAHRRHGDLM